MPRHTRSRSVFSRLSHRRAIPGMRTCGNCGRPYSPAAMICPRCHGLGDSKLTPTKPTVEAVGPIFILDLTPKTSPARVYPDWLIAADEECRHRVMSEIELVAMRVDIAPELRDLARAMLALRKGLPLPQDIDLNAVEKWVSHIVKKS